MTDPLNTVIMIPARYGSTRYPGKPLVALRGPDGPKTLIQRAWERAGDVSGVSAVYVATDDGRIADEVIRFGGAVLMTSPEARNGTERCAEALDQLETKPDLVVNLQGDAPLTPPWFLEALIARMAAEPSLDVATPVLRCDAATLAHFQADRRAGRVGGTTAVFDQDGHALYFSKEVIPYLPDATPPEPIPVFHHVGVYAYRPAALAAYAQAPEGRLETLEGLEQLRFLEAGHRVACVEVDARGRLFWELNNPVDVERIEEVLNG